MFDRSRFNRTSFNLAGDGTPTFYATITSRYGAEAGPLRVLVQIGVVAMDVEAQLDVGNLGLYTRLSETILAAEFSVLPNFTALIPLGAVCMEAQSEVTIFMGAKMPLGEVVLASVFTVLPTLGVSVPLKGIDLRSEFEVKPKFGVLISAVPVTLGSTFEIMGMLRAKLPLRRTALTSEYGLVLKSIRFDNANRRSLQVTVIWADRYL